MVVRPATWRRSGGRGMGARQVKRRSRCGQRSTVASGLSSMGQDHLGWRPTCLSRAGRSPRSDQDGTVGSRGRPAQDERSPPATRTLPAGDLWPARRLRGRQRRRAARPRPGRARHRGAVGMDRPEASRVARGGGLTGANHEGGQNRGETHTPRSTRMPKAVRTGLRAGPPRHLSFDVSGRACLRVDGGSAEEEDFARQPSPSGGDWLDGVSLAPSLAINHKRAGLPCRSLGGLR
jgi:hypothetical protein